MESLVHQLLHYLALPQWGLSTVFVVAFLSATLLPLGSEPVVFGLVSLDHSLFWPAVLVATLGNTLGGALNWWMGLGAHRAVDHIRHRATHTRALDWLQRLGPRACFLSFLPVIGDPLCLLAGWQRLPLWPCVGWMALGKCLRYITMTALLLWGVPEHWLQQGLCMVGMQCTSP